MKDRVAGLAFRWRAGAGRHSVSAFFALLITILVGLFLFYGVTLSLPQSEKVDDADPVVIKVVSPNHPQIRSKTQFSSPFLDRWDPAFDDEVNTRIQAISRSSLLKLSYQARPLIEAPKESFDESFPKISSNANLLPKLDSAKQSKPGPKGKCKLVINGLSKDLASRVPKKLPVFKEKINWSKRGLSFEFVVSVSPQGSVLHCSPIGGASMEGLEFWVRNIRFAAGAAGDVTSMLEVNIEEVKP